MPTARTGCRVIAVACAITLLCSRAVQAGEPRPQWVARADARVPGQLTKTFTIDRPTQAGTLKLAADFCTAAVTLNGRSLLTVEPYCPLQQVDLTPHLRRGRNELELSIAPIDGPAAAALSCRITAVDGTVTTVVTDDSWTGAVTCGAVLAGSWGLERRSAEISPFDNYEQWRQVGGLDTDKGPKFWIAPGFEIARVRQAGPEEGSWIALAFDPQGRAILSREDTGLLRMTLADDRQSVTRVEAIDVDLPECRGLLSSGEWLYANANNARTMYRLKIDAAGKARDVETLRTFAGGVGHGRNDLAQGADGWIYSIHGDSVETPPGALSDRTSPFRESRRGPPRQEGHVVRSDRDAKTWELFCTGLRNPYGIAFNERGDLFTYDADNEYDMGTPWYRPTRIVQLVSGADYGWRVAQGRWPPEFPDRPDNGLPTLDVGRGSPTSVLFGTHLRFPAPYRDALFALDWAYGRVLAVNLSPRGAGYRGALELFLQGKPLNVTDLAAGPDGALWIITGGRKTRSALFRIVSTSPPAADEQPSAHEVEAVAWSQTQRAVRLQLETLHVRPEQAALQTAWERLADFDPMIRHAARIAIEQHPRSELLARFDALPSSEAGRTSGRGRLEFLQSVARTGDPGRVRRIADELLELQPEQLDLSARFALVFLYSECLTLAPRDIEARGDALIRQLTALWPDPAAAGLQVSPFGTNLELRRRLARLLSALGDPKIVDRVAQSLLVSDAQEDRLLALLTLSTIRDGWTPETRRAFFTTLRDAQHFVGGEGMPTFLQRLRTDSMARLTDRERLDLQDLLVERALDDDPLPPPRPPVAEWTLDDLRPLAARGAPAGDAQRGAAIFREALCSRCHRAGARGPAVGPDLTFVGRRFGRDDLLEAIVEPSRSVAENYRNLSILTESGRLHVGRLANAGDFRAEKLRLSVEPLRPAQIVEIDKKEVVEERVLESSPMPGGLLNTFTREQIADLLAFLEQGAVNGQ